MVLVGKSPDQTQNQHVAGYVGPGIFVVSMTPWLMLSGGLIWAGCLAMSRGESGLAILIPAGIAVIVLPLVISYLHGQWHPTVVWFEFDGANLKYRFNDGGDCHTRSITEVTSVYRSKKPKGRNVRGYFVTFRDRKTIFVPSWLTNAAELAEVLNAGIAAR